MPLSAPCHAGHYSAPLYGGTGHWANGGSTPYGSLGNGAWGMAYGGAPAYGYRSISCSGTITSRFTWVPDGAGDNPPDQVIIAETCTASFNASGTTPDGAADNDLGFDPVINTYSGSKTGTSSGTRYRIVSGADPLDITASPSSSASATNGMLYATMSYISSASVPSVNLEGGIGDPWAKRFLIGQMCRATVTTILVPSSYEWHVTGGAPFSDYVPGETSGIYTPVGTETDSVLVFRFARQASATVACSLNLIVPAGAKPAGGLAITLFRPCVVDVPTYTYRKKTGVVEFVGTPPTKFRPYGATDTSVDDPTDSGTAGSIWAAKVVYPAGYTNGPHELGWNYTQLITTFRSRVNNGVVENVSMNGQTVLDTTFGYSDDFPTGTEHVYGDSPDEGLASVLSSVSVNDNFKTYIMFIPLGTGSRYVPLQYWTWYWKAEARQDAGTGTWSFMAGSNVAGSADGGSFPSHPVWTNNISNRTWQ